MSSAKHGLATETVRQKPPRTINSLCMLGRNASMSEQTKEFQYQFLLELEKQGLEQLGLMSSYAWSDDPRHLLFILARYKFVAKMFSGMKKVLEVGCADAFGTRI